MFESVTCTSCRLLYIYSFVDLRLRSQRKKKKRRSGESPLSVREQIITTSQSRTTPIILAHTVEHFLEPINHPKAQTKSCWVLPASLPSVAHGHARVTINSTGPY